MQKRHHLLGSHATGINSLMIFFHFFYFFFFFFFDHGLKFQDSASNGCHDLTILCLNVSDIAIITAKNVYNI